MKVLFAVNDENISTSIVKKYQKQYKEIISYKNVYYFNAIFKELQKNKSYDRIVISEDLEEFTSSSYSQKDKFIFERLDNISDEAVSTDGTDIPIILICSERRTQSEDILVKIFGIGIYNAILGDDISLDEVCRLINKPRSKKEAKVYYRIDSENVSYEKESDNEVSEVEMQNILNHFRKISDFPEKYSESFRNIVSQYNDKQLKVIISILPENVKEVLEDTSQEYRKLASSKYDRNLANSKIKKTAKTEKNKTNEKLLKSDNTHKLTRPVIVPKTIETNLYKKVEDKKELELDLEEIEPKDIEIPDSLVDRARKRGRPKKNQLEEEEFSFKPKKRGRPKKNQFEEEQEEIEENNQFLPGFEEEQEENISVDKTSENPKSVNKASNFSIGEDGLIENYNTDEYTDDISLLPRFDDNSNYNENEENIFNEHQEKNDEHTKPQENNNEEHFNNDNIMFEEAKNISPNSNKTIREIKVFKNNIGTKKAEPDANELKEDNLIKQPKNEFDTSRLDGMLSGSNRIATFVGTSKNGTSFIINNIAQILSSMGINTAILDATKNKNSFYIYTKNDEQLRQIAINSLSNLANGIANGVKVNNNLTVYTTIPSQYDDINNAYAILETLIKNHSLVLIDSDFDTPVEYFEKASDLYLIQSMDVLTIQPLTAFLRDLKEKSVLEENKIKIILNKVLRVRGITGKNIVGGMSNYNDPEMSFMTELFDRNVVKIAGQIPFDEDVYAKYLESIVECEVKINGYPKEFRQRLNLLAEVIYPFSSNNKKEKGKNNEYSNNFSSGMNNTLDNMRKRY